MSEIVQENVVAQFSPFWQEAVVGHMLQDPVFFLACKTFIQYAWFENPLVAALAKYSYDFQDQYKRPLKNWKELDGIVRVIHTDIPTQTKYLNQIQTCIKATESVGLDVLRQQMTLWVKMAKFKNGVTDATRIFNQKRYEDAAQWLSKVTKDISSASFDDDDVASFADPLAFFAEQEETLKFCCTLGHPDFDELVLEGAKIKHPQIPMTSKGLDSNNLKHLTNGGLILGDSTIIMGGANVGKTSTVITIIAANVMMGKDVLLITHEQRDATIKFRIYQCMMGMIKEDLRNLTPTSPVAQIAEATSRLLMEHLVYVPHIKSGQMYAEDVIAKIMKHNSNRQSKINKGFDMVVDDYPGILKSKAMKDKKSEVWDEKRDVYFQFMTCMREIKAHGIFPIQLNREGFKLGKGKEDRFAGLGDVSQSFGVMQDADNVISINRFEKDKANNTIQFVVAKCRSSLNDYVFVSYADLPVCRTHHPSLKAMTLAPGQKVCEQELQMLAAENRAKEAQSIFNPVYDSYPTLKRWPFDIDLNMALRGYPKCDIMTEEETAILENIMEDNSEVENEEPITWSKQ